MSRRILIAGNWKMNKTSAEGAELVNGIRSALTDCCADKLPEVLVCPPFLDIATAVCAAKGSAVEVGAQNVHWASSGAYTGECSTAMLLDAGCTHVIVGHSERRQYFGETDATVNKRAKAAVDAGLVAVVCVGETLEERESGATTKVVGRQVREAFSGFSANDMSKVVVAYEPVWAIGTGKVATDEQAQEVHAFIRKTLGEMFGSECGDSVRILYGGSMKPGNAAGLLKQKDIDGGLIGGASLKADDFVAIIKAAMA